MSMPIKCYQLAFVIASLITLPGFVASDKVEGPVKSYTQGKEIVLTVNKLPMIFRITEQTKFLDGVGKEWPRLADPKDGIWSLSETVTVKFNKSGTENLAEYIQFPYGVVDPCEIKEGDTPPEPNGKMPELKVKPGSKMPDFSLKTFTGKALTNKSLRGKVVVFDFWATWCGPCKMMSPIMQKLHTKYSKRGLVVVAPSMDDNISLAKDYAKEHKYTFEFASAGTLPKTLAVSGIPLVLVVDQKGIVRHVEPGFSDSTEATLMKQVEKLLTGGKK